MQIDEHRDQLSKLQETEGAEAFKEVGERGRRGGERKKRKRERERKKRE